MSAPLSRVYPERVERARRSPLLQVVPAIIIVGLLGIAGVGFAWSSAVRNKHAQTEDYNLLEKGLVETEQTNAQLRGQLSVVAGRLQLTPEEEAAAQRIAELRRELSATAGATELDTKVSSSALEHVSAKSRRALASVRKELDNAKRDMQATIDELNKRLERNQNEIEQLRTAGQHTDYDFALNGKGAKSTVAGVTIELRDSNLKKNQFNMTLVFGTTRLVQKNRSLDEPIFFYLPNDTAPMELVVDKLARHRVSGRLIVPKSSFTTASDTPTHPSP